MTDSVLDILKLALLALLYLFFARVLWAVASEVRSSGPRPAEAAHPGPLAVAGSAAAAVAAVRRPTGGPPSRVVILEPKKHKGTSYTVDGLVSIGREPDNTVMIVGDAFVSSYHARVWSSDGEILIDDRGSKNGTYVNGDKLVGQRPLHDGDRIQVGYTIMEARA